MIKFLNAVTEEIDDAGLAVDDLLKALNFKDNLKKNSVGIVTCYAEFIDTGVVKLLSESVPFEILGTTTLQNGTDGAQGRLMLTLTVLTSDDVEFAVAHSESIYDQREKPITEMYGRALDKMKARPDLILVFAPLIYHVCGDEISGVLDKASDGVPVFGTLSVDHTRDYSESRVIYNGKAYNNGIAILLMRGVKPDFCFAALPENKIQKQKAIITASDGSLLKEVSGIKIGEYVHSLGLAPGDGVNVIPFMVDYNDGTRPSARAIHAFTSEGYAACGGEMPVGATLGIGSLDYDDVLAGAKKALDEILTGDRKINGLIIFSCIGRNLVLGTDYFAEAEVIRKAVGGRVPYLLCYSGGEICPTLNSEGKECNRFHNYTMIICKI